MHFQSIAKGAAVLAIAAALIGVGSKSSFASETPSYQEWAAREQAATDAFFNYLDAGKLSTKLSRAITSPEGIDVMEAVELNGMEQWISIRGVDKDAPVLLYLHGGPGAVTMPFMYSMSPEWEKNFVMVHWDQRGTGKTRCANPDYDPRDASFDDFYADTVALVNYLREKLGRDKIIVLGHSWGTLLGTHLAKNEPDFLYAYVGTGQMTNTIESERNGYEWALAEARRLDDQKGIAYLESIAPYPPAEDIPTQQLDRAVAIQRGHLQKYGGALQFDYMEKVRDAFFNSPDYDMCDWMGFFDTQLGGEPYPHRDLTGQFLKMDAGLANFDQDLGFDFDVPIFFFLGAKDHQTSTEVATRYFEKINAPQKKLILFEKSGHGAPLTEEDEFVADLVEYVRPLAAGEEAE